MQHFVKNTGYTKTILMNNKKAKIQELNWDAEYDGGLTKVHLEINDDDKKTKKIDIQLTQKDVDDILSVHPVKQDIQQRLKDDYQRKIITLHSKRKISRKKSRKRRKSKGQTQKRKKNK